MQARPLHELRPVSSRLAAIQAEKKPAVGDFITSYKASPLELELRDSLPLTSAEHPRYIQSLLE
jgi:hypothetical protein